MSVEAPWRAYRFLVVELVGGRKVRSRVATIRRRDPALDRFAAQADGMATGPRPEPEPAIEPETLKLYAVLFALAFLAIAIAVGAVVN